MTARALRGVLVAALLGLNGAHMAVLQMAAWARMAVHFSRTTTVQCALAKTLDGEHPCALCMKLRKAPAADASLGMRGDEGRIDQALGAPPQLWASAICRARISHRPLALPAGLSSPDFPPPR